MVPAADAACGAPADARTLLVTALGAFPPTEATARSRPVAQGIEFEIGSFPAETRVLAVQVIGTGGAVRTVGHTAPFDLASLEDGAEVPVFMAPQRGFCPTGPPLTPRIAPLVARVDQAVFVAGGRNEAGQPVYGMERYNHATGRFDALAVDLYADDALGLIGATMTAVGGGRVLIAGGSRTAYQVFDSASGTVSAARFLSEARAHHAAVWLGDDRVLLVGGCARLEPDGACDPTSVLATTTIIDLAAERVSDGPPLARPRAGASVVREADGRVLVVGGVDDTGTPATMAERIDPARERSGEEIPGVAGIAAPLAAGGSFAGFATVDAPAETSGAVVPPGALVATPVASTMVPRAGVTATPLEDGRVLVFGGLTADAGDEALYYLPSDATFEALAASPVRGGAVLRRRDHAAVRLLDGTVLIVGGRDASGAALGDAWIYRPELTGPFAADATVSFADSLLAQQVIPRDPGRMRVEVASGPPTRLVVTASGGGSLPSEWFVIGGPAFVRSTVALRARSAGGGIAVLLWFRDATHHAVVTLAPGQPASLYELDGAAPRAVGGCARQVVDSTDIQGEFANVTVEVTSEAVVVKVGARTMLSCSGLEQTQPGYVGAGVVGAEGATLEVASMTVRR